MAARAPQGSGVYTRQNFLSIYLPSIALAIGTGIIIPALPVYARSFGVPFEVASLIIIVQQIGHTVTAYPIGLLMDRIGRRKIVLAGPLFLAVSSILMALAGSFAELLIYRFIAGMGETMWRVGRLTMIADTGGDRQRGRQITTMSAMENAGRLISPLIGGVLAVYFDLRAPFIAHAVLCVVAIIPSFILIRETAPHLVKAAGRAVEAAAAAPDKGMRALLVLPVIMFFVAQLFASFARGPVFTGQLNLYGAYAYDLGPEAIAILATLTAVIGLPVSLASGWIMDHFGRKATLVPGFSLLLVSFVMLALTSVLPVPYAFFMGAYLCVYACTSLTGGNMQTLGSDIAPPSARGRFYGVSQTLGNIGGPLATTSFAVLSAALGYWSAFIFLGFTAGAAAFILGTQVRDRVREERLAARRLTSAEPAPAPAPAVEGEPVAAASGGAQSDLRNGAVTHAEGESASTAGGTGPRRD
jgi:MFS family permease